MESPVLAPGSPLEDEESFACRGCGLQLEEGKAFELDGKRWHIECFSCNTCGTLLDSDANLLLLGDGSLICNNCTYSCAVCTNKIEDLAILTGDQAYCAGCFRCRNCKRKIENLRYARTSQGIFCMTCHETVMAKRKKKLKAQKLASMQSPQLSLDKSLPSLPVDEEAIKDTFAGATPTELSPPPPRPSARPQAQPRSTPRQPDYSSFVPSPQINRSYTDGNGVDSNLRMPRSYNQNRHSHISHASDASDAFQMLAGGGDPNEPYSFIPLVLDPSPGPLPSQAYRREPSPNDLRNDERVVPPSRSYTSPPVELPAELPSRSHIAYQEKPRADSYGSQRNGRPSQDSTRERMHNASASQSSYQSRPSKTQSIAMPSGFFELDSGSPVTTPTPKEEKKEPFKLGEVPRSRKAGSKSQTPTEENPSSPTTPSVDAGYAAFPTSAAEPNAPTSAFPPRQDSTKPPPARTDRKALDSPEYSGSTTDPSRATSRSNSSGTSADYFENQIRKENSDSTLRTGSVDSGLQKAVHPPRTSSNTAARASPSRELSAPRSNAAAGKRHSMINPGPAPKPPGPPGNAARSPTGHSTSASLSLIPQTSPVLQDTLVSPIGGLSMEEDIAKIFGDDNPSGQLFRRASTAVRHGRSYSDLAGRTAHSPNWPRSPSLRTGRRHVNSYGEVTSPIVTVESKEENAMLKHELRLSSQRIAELESKLNSQNAVANNKALESNIQEKRSTVAVLETKRETMLREIGVLKEAKSEEMDNERSSQLTNLTHNLRSELDKLKGQYDKEIEGLIARRNDLKEEVGNLVSYRDQVIQETTQLNLKNAQLADLNNEITRQIQGKFKANKAALPGMTIGPTQSGGLGIQYSQMQAPDGDNGLQDTAEAEAAVFTAHTQVLNVKRNQPKKTQWYKKGATVVRGAGKGLKTVFASDNTNQNQQQDRGDGGLYENSIPYNSDTMRSKESERHFFTQRFGRDKRPIPGQMGQMDEQLSQTQSHQSHQGGVPLFGSDLQARAEYENQRIPTVVTKCIQEVEIRGMDFQGIYRKTGGASQMRSIQEAFERGDDIDLSDSSIDICAVTSVLKQYFRKLPVPLLTFEIYDKFLDSHNIPDDARRKFAMQAIIDELPETHREILQFVIFHLARVADRRDENLMTSRNLAVVFAPTLMRDRTGEREMNDMHAKNNAIQFLIDHHKAIFRIDTPVGTPGVGQQGQVVGGSNGMTLPPNTSGSGGSGQGQQQQSQAQADFVGGTLRGQKLSMQQQQVNGISASS